MRKLGTLWRCHPYFRIKISISISCYLRLSHQPIMEKAVLEALGDKKPEEVANQTITCIVPPSLYNSY